MNPQIRFGEDLMSRVSYSMMNPGGEAEMTAAVRTAMDALVGELCAEAKADPQDVLELVFVGNPIMHHLLLGIDPVELGGAPFALATDSALELLAPRARPARVNPGCRVYILPCIAGHVGADCAGVVLSETPWLNEEITLRRRCRHQRRDRAGQQGQAARLLLADRARPSRVRRSATASARRRVRSSGCGSTGTRWSRASR